MYGRAYSRLERELGPKCGEGDDRNGTGRTPFGLSIGDPQREGGRDRDLERVAKRCDRPPGDGRGGSETGRRSVTEGGDRATAVTGVRRRPPAPWPDPTCKLHSMLYQSFMAPATIYHEPASDASSD